MTEPEDDPENGREGDAEDEELDLDELFDTIPEERGESSDSIEAEPVERETETSLLGDEGFEELLGDEEPEIDAEDLGESEREALLEFGGDESDSPRFEDFELPDSESGEGERKPGSGRFDRLLTDIEPSDSSKDFDELLTSLTESQSKRRSEREAVSGDSEEAPEPGSTEIRFEADRSGLMDASDTLFMGARGGRSQGDTCHPLLSTYSLEDKNVLLISLQDSSEDRLDSFYEHQKGQLANLAVVTGSDGVRSTTTTKGTSDDRDSANISIKVVNDPGDLTRLGITISNVLQTWNGNGNDTIVCFDSLSALLQYADLQRVFRFVHVLQGRLDEVNARTHYHLEPDAHDRRTIGTLQPLFDGTLRRADDGALVYE